MSKYTETYTELIDALEYLISEDCTDTQYDFIGEIKDAINCVKIADRLERVSTQFQTNDRLKDEKLRLGYALALADIRGDIE